MPVKTNKNMETHIQKRGERIAIAMVAHVVWLIHSRLRILLHPISTYFSRFYTFSGAKIRRI